MYDNNKKIQTFASCLTAAIAKWTLAYNIVNLVANAHLQFLLSSNMQRSVPVLKFDMTMYRCGKPYAHYAHNLYEQLSKL